MPTIFVKNKKFMFVTRVNDKHNIYLLLNSKGVKIHLKKICKIIKNLTFD